MNKFMLHFFLEAMMSTDDRLSYARQEHERNECIFIQLQNGGTNVVRTNYCTDED